MLLPHQELLQHITKKLSTPLPHQERPLHSLINHTSPQMERLLQNSLKPFPTERLNKLPLTQMNHSPHLSIQATEMILFTPMLVQTLSLMILKPPHQDLSQRSQPELPRELFLNIPYKHNKKSPQVDTLLPLKKPSPRVEEFHPPLMLLEPNQVNKLLFPTKLLQAETLPH